jgi:hypothetical protein
MCARFLVVDDAREQPTQLDGGRQFALLLIDGADRGGIGLGDHEHPKSMAMRSAVGKRGVPPGGQRILWKVSGSVCDLQDVP